MNEYIMYAYINKLFSSYQYSNYLTYLKLHLIQDDGPENETNLESTRCQETSATSPPLHIDPCFTLLMLINKEISLLKNRWRIFLSVENQENMLCT